MDDKIQLVKFESWHLESLRQQMIEMAVVDPRILAYVGLEDICERGTGFSLLYKGEPIGCAGIIPFQLGVGHAWTAVNRLAVADKTRVVYTHAKVGFRAIERKFHRVETVTLVGDRIATSWVTHLGFYVESVMKKYGTDKSDYFKWVYFPEER